MPITFGGSVAANRVEISMIAVGVPNFLYKTGDIPKILDIPKTWRGVSKNLGGYN